MAREKNRFVRKFTQLLPPTRITFRKTSSDAGYLHKACSVLTSRRHGTSQISFFVHGEKLSSRCLTLLSFNYFGSRIAASTLNLMYVLISKLCSFVSTCFEFTLPHASLRCKLKYFEVSKLCKQVNRNTLSWKISNLKKFLWKSHYWTSLPSSKLKTVQTIGKI